VAVAAVVVVMMVVALGVGGYLVLARGPGHQQVGGPSGAGSKATPAPVAQEPVVLEPTGPPAGRVVVTPAMADRVVRHHWPVHEEALHNKDLGLLASLTGGSARRWEVNAVACRCMVIDEVRPFLGAVYFVPRQTSYPARFIAEVRTRQSSDVESIEILTFSRSGPRARWLVIENSGFTPVVQPAPLVKADTTAAGFTRPVSPARVAKARSVARQLAAVLQETKNTGEIPFSAQAFMVEGQTEHHLTELAKHRQDTVHSNGLFGHARYYTSKADPLVVVSHVAGYVIACQPIHADMTYTPGRGRVVYQDPGQRNWGPTVKPGQYRSITVHN
jgi:hypothetical protein